MSAPKPTLQILLLSLSAIAPLMATKVVNVISPMVVKRYTEIMGGHPLPTLTDAFLLKFAGSNIALGLGLVISAVILILIVTRANPKRPMIESGPGLQTVLAFVGPFVAMLYFAVAFVAATVPLVTPIAR